MKLTPILVAAGVLTVGYLGLNGPDRTNTSAIPLTQPEPGDGGVGESPYIEMLPSPDARELIAPTPPDESDVIEQVEPEAWVPSEGSPVALLDYEAWGSFYAPTLENMSVQIRAVPTYEHLTDEQLQAAWDTPGFQEAWQLNREHLALRTFIVGYQQREYDRWLAGQGSVALETEIQPVVSFITAFPDPDAAWKAIDAYSVNVINAIYESGEDQPQRDDVPAKWDLFGEFTKQSGDATNLVDQTLNELL